MRRIALAGLVVSLFLIAAPHAPAGEKASAPGVVVRVKSLEALLQNLNLVVKLVGQEEAAQQIEGLIKSKIGKKGINGIDPARPIGAYVRFGKEIDAPSGAVLIPVADEASILGLLDNLGLEYKKDKNGIYTHKTNKNVDVYFRFENQYLYITSLNAANIEQKNLPDPAKALAMPGDATISILTRMDQIPAETKEVALRHLDEAIQTAKKEGLPGESKKQAAFRMALLDDAHQFGKSVLDQATDVRFDLDASDKTKELTFNMSINGKPQSELAKSIQAMGNLKSPLAGPVSKDSAFHGAFHFALPPALHKAFVDIIDEASANSLAGIQDAGKKKQAEALFNAILPSAKTGEYQVVAAVIGPKADRYAFLGAVKLKDGLKLGAAAHELIADAVKQLPEADRTKVQLDFDSVGPAKIHKFEVPKDPALDKLINDVAGDKYLYLAFRDDAMFLALGKDALLHLKTALAKTESVASSPLVFDVDVARMAHWLATTPLQKDGAKAILAADASSRVRITVEGGTSLRISMRTHFNVMELMMKMHKAK